MTLVCITTANTTVYDRLHGMLCMAGAELERLGHEVEFLDVSTSDCFERLKALTSGRRDIIGMGLSGVGMEIRTDDGTLF